MILAFIGISAALYGGAMLAGVVQAWHRPFAFLALTGQPLTKGFMLAGAVVSAVLVGAGYGALLGGLDRVG